MDDIFYLSQKDINMLMFAELLKEKFNNINIRYSTTECIQVIYKNSFFEFYIMEIGEFREEEDIIILRENDIKKIVGICLHLSELPKALELVKVILETYGGLIGNDNYGFAPVFTMETLDLFKRKVE